MGVKNTDERILTIRNALMAVLVIVFFTSIILLYYTMLYDEKKLNIIRSGEVAAKESADHINHYLSTNIDSVELAAYTLDEMITEHRSDDEIQDYLVGQSTAVRSAVIENSTGLYGYINGRFFSGTNWEPPADYVATERPWYTRPMENPGQITILDPYVDVQSGNIMLALGHTLCDGVSVVSVDVSLDQIQKLTEDAVASGNSDMEMLLNDKGEVVAHSVKAEIGKDYGAEAGTFGAELFDHIKNGDSYFEFIYMGEDYIVYVADVQNGWFCVSVKDATRVFGSVNTILFITIFVVIAIVAIISMIMKRTNSYLQMSTKAVAANEAKSEFLSNMSHEIRTPINAMLGMNEMILRESNDKSILSYSENIKTAGKSLLRLVNDILDFSKIEAGKMELITVDYDLSSLISDLINSVHNRTEDKGLTLELKLDRDIPRHLHGDEMRIRQVISNLLSNAVKYTEKGGIVFSMGYESIDGDAGSILLKVSVKDTGIGIKEEDRKKLFEQFVRIEEDRNRNIEGTGLGMNITKSLLEMMGSTLEVESTYGEGSVFSFALKQKVTDREPLGDYSEAYRKQLLEKEGYHEKFTAKDARILVVDDNPMNLLVFKSLVKQTGVTVDTGDSGFEAVTLTSGTKYDMIFLDHMMPEKDGIETLNEIRNDPGNPNRDTPYVCLTANAISGARDMYISAGFDDYLSKPIDPDTLEEMMLEFLPDEKIKMWTPAGEETEDDDANSEKIREALKALTGSPIDAETGLKNSGTPSAYLALLRIFRESMDEKADELNLLFNNKDFENYTIKVHALKSSARIIGAGDFGEEAQELENAGKAGDEGYIISHHEAFIDKYDKFREPLSAVFAALDSDTEKPEADPDLMKTIFEEIKSAAVDMDCERLDAIFEEMQDYSIPADSRELYERLREYSEKYEYKNITGAL